MDRVPAITRDEAKGEVARLYKHADILLSRTPNSWMVMARQPFATKFMLPLTSTLMRQGIGSVLETSTKELAIIRTSQVNECAY